MVATSKKKKPLLFFQKKKKKKVELKTRLHLWNKSTARRSIICPKSVSLQWINKNKRAKMAVDRSLDPLSSSQQSLRQASFDDKWVKNVSSRVLTGFFNIWAVWPSFWSQVTHIQTWHRNHQNKLAIFESKLQPLEC
jgi:hypothetical protein